MQILPEGICREQGKETTCKDPSQGHVVIFMQVFFVTFVYLCLKILLEIHKDMVYKDMFRDICLLVFENIVGDSQGHGLQGHVS